MADYHQILRDLQGKNNVEMNLNRMVALSKDAAYRFSLISFAFYDMTFFEGLNHRNENNPYQDLIGRLVQLKEAYLQGHEVSFQDIAALRTENTHRMEALTKAVDVFTLLEYVLNRMEHRFIGQTELPEGYTDLSETEKLMRFLSNEQQESQNFYLYRMVEQLPVRMTKNRFYETVKERLTVYKGSDTAAFDGILASVLSASCAFVFRESVPGYEDLFELFRKITGTDPASVGRTDFETWQDRLRTVGERINSDMDCSQALQNVLNTFGAVLLTAYEGRTVPAEKPQTDIILGTVMDAFGKESPDLSAAYEACHELEGTLEDAGEYYHQIFSAMDELENRFVFDDGDVKKIGMLLSNSAYAELQRDELLTGAVVDDPVFEYAAGQLIRELSAFYAELPRAFVRASMARVFSILPPRFSDTEGVETYINEALSGCHDTAEKLGVLELLDGMMSEA